MFEAEVGYDVCMEDPKIALFEKLASSWNVTMFGSLVLKDDFPP